MAPTVTTYTLHVTSHRLPVTTYTLPVTSHRVPVTTYTLPGTGYRVPVSENYVPINQLRFACKPAYRYPHSVSNTGSSSEKLKEKLTTVFVDPNPPD